MTLHAAVELRMVPHSCSMCVPALLLDECVCLLCHCTWLQPAHTLLQTSVPAEGMITTPPQQLLRLPPTSMPACELEHMKASCWSRYLASLLAAAIQG